MSMVDAVSAAASFTVFPELAVVNSVGFCWLTKHAQSVEGIRRVVGGHNVGERVQLRKSSHFRGAI